MTLCFLLLLAFPLSANSSNSTEAALKKLKQQEALLQDYVAFYRAQEALEKKKEKKAIQLLESLIQKDQLSEHLKTKAARALGQAYCQSGQTDQARSFYRELISREQQSNTGVSRIPFWQLEQAQCLIKLKQKNKAFTLLRKLYLQDNQGQISESVLKILSQNNGRQAIATGEHESKGRRLLSTRPQLASLSFAAAAQAYPALPPLGLQQNLAEAYFRSRQYPKAAQAYATLKKSFPSAWDEKKQLRLAQAYSRSDQFDLAIQTYQNMYGNSGKNSNNLAYKIAFLTMDKGDLKEANRLFEEILNQSPKHRQRAKIYWFLAWNHYQLKNYEESLVYLNLLSSQFSRSPYSRRVPYWRARIAEEQGNASLAQTRYQDIARSRAGSYYGLLSEWRLSGRFPEQLKLPPVSQNLNSSPRLLASIPGSNEDKKILQALYEAGLWEDFLGELQIYLQSRAASEFLSSAERQGYPQPYQNWVNFYSSRYQIPSALIYAIMREESRFNPTVMSPADAVGLMQIIPPTGLEIAQDLERLGFSVDWLTQPLVNAEFGTYYLSKNAKRFNQNLAQTIASYNAGPDAVTRWITARPNSAWDEFVEEIPYKETHNYVKKVLKSYQRYGGI